LNEKEIREKQVRQEALITPGDKLYVIEEYIPGPGTYSDQDGWIRSAIVGRVVIDKVQKLVCVKHVRNKPFIPKPGDIVLGVVSSISEDLAFIDIFQIEGKNSRSIDFTGVIHVSQASDKFIETLYDAMRLGDVVRAKVLNDRIPYQLTTKGPQFGVIAALCSRCGALMKKHSDETLICPRCGNIEKRKISIKYVVK